MHSTDKEVCEMQGNHRQEQHGALLGVDGRWREARVEELDVGAGSSRCACLQASA